MIRNKNFGKVDFKTKQRVIVDFIKVCHLRAVYLKEIQDHFKNQVLSSIEAEN